MKAAAAGTVHVVGAGLAGLAAALAAADRGRAVRVWEAAPRAGGRARALPEGAVEGEAGGGGPPLDNGTHVLLGANRRALAFLGRIGARGAWVEPEPDGLPVVDLADGTARRVGLSPWSWARPARRPAGLDRAGLLGLARLGLPAGGGRDRTVAALMAGAPALLRSLVEPLTVAALNTPAAEASARRLAPVLRRLARPGAARVLVASRGLGPDLVEPAAAALAGAGGTVAFGHRLRAVRVEGGRAAALDFGAAGTAGLGPDDAAILALPAPALAKVLPPGTAGVAPPRAFESILNLHYGPAGYDGPVRFVGVLGGAAQWLLLRPGTGIAVTVSAARGAVDRPAAELAAEVWAEVRAALGLAGITADLPAAPPPCRAVKERRATPRQAAGDVPALPPARWPLANLRLAGDWLGPLPATLEAAVASGEAAAASLPRPARRGAGTAEAGAGTPERRGAPA